MDVNGSVRPRIESYKPGEYIGVDIVPGRRVDVICDATKIVEKFGPDSFDIVISTELIEHIRDWRSAIHNIKAVCKPGGTILITTRSFGFQYHGYPYDFWRYEPEDMSRIFGDCVIEKIERDPDRGVFIKAIKPERFIERDLSDYALYSIIAGKRVKRLEVWREEVWKFLHRMSRRRFAGKCRGGL